MAYIKAELLKSCMVKVRVHTNSAVKKLEHKIVPDSTPFRTHTTVYLANGDRALCSGMWVPWITENYPEHFPTSMDYFPKR